MKVTFNKNELTSALDRVQRAAQTKINSNTNNGFFISAANGIVEFQANDFVMEMGKGENTVSFKSGSYFSKFPVRNSQDFPEVEEMDHQNHAVIRCKDFADMVSLVQFAAATDKQKPFFTGVLFEIHDSLFAMAATNTHRLATKEISLDEPATAAGRIIVPAGILSDVIRLLPDGEEEKMEISWSKNHVAFTIGSTYFISNLINGEYPEYQRVIPQSFDAHAELNLHDFAEAVRFVSPISRDVNYNTINFHFKQGVLEVFEEDPEIGRSDTSIPVKLEGDDIDITFNCSYIEDILKHSKGETITLHLLKSGPMLVEQQDDKTYRYVVTPMRGRN